jgi:hypothetical protein
VPKAVQLFDVTPIAVKPVNVSVAVADDGTVTFQGSIRLLGTQFNAATAAGRTVTVAWTGTDNQEATVQASAPTYGNSLYLNTTNTFYTFSAPLAKAGVQSFVVRVTEGGATTQFDNDGARFALDDSVAWLPTHSSFIVDAATNLLHGTVAAAVHTSVNPKTVAVTLNLPVPQQGAQNPTIQAVTLPLTRGAKIGKSNYFLYTTTAPSFAQLQPGTRSPLLAAQGTLDLSATQHGQPSNFDASRLISDVGVTMQ